MNFFSFVIIKLRNKLAIGYRSLPNFNRYILHLLENGNFAESQKVFNINIFVSPSIKPIKIFVIVFFMCMIFYGPDT